MSDLSVFSSVEEAEAAIKKQVLSLCQTYTHAIKTVLPILKRASNESRLHPIDNRQFNELANEGKDHLHNLTQLKEELDHFDETAQYSLLELSAEVLANVTKYLHTMPAQIEKTKIYISDN